MDKYTLLSKLTDGTAPDSAPVTCGNQHCAMTGQPIEQGYELHKIVDKATSDQAALFRYSSQYLSVTAASLLKTRISGSFLITPDEVFYPAVSAASGKVLWRELIFQLEEGTPTVSIVSEEFQRRLWHLSALSTFGSHWRPYFHAGNDSRLLNINIFTLRDYLAFIEELLNRGFTKSAIRVGLAPAKGFSVIETLRLEAQLRAIRSSDNFLLALYFAQKEA